MKTTVGMWTAARNQKEAQDKIMEVGIGFLLETRAAAVNFVRGMAQFSSDEYLVFPVTVTAEVQPTEK